VILDATAADSKRRFLVLKEVLVPGVAVAVAVDDDDVDDDVVVPIVSFVGVADDAMMMMLPTSTVLAAHSKVEYLINTFLFQILVVNHDIFISL